MNTPSIKSTSLHFREGSSDKVYQAAVEPKDDGYIVTYAYGRRGSTLSTGINRRGLVVAIPDVIRQAVEELPMDVLIDGEAVGNILQAFDLLEMKGHNLCQRGYIQRYAGLLTLLDPEHKHLRPVITIVHPADKLTMFKTYKQTGSEGAVFKDFEAPFSIGRPHSCGIQLKHEFVESASFIVTALKAKRSVALGLFDGNELVGAGNVTIPPNPEIPQQGTVVEVSYLYAFRESGSIYQLVYLGKREAIPTNGCVTDQLEYKGVV